MDLKSYYQCIRDIAATLPDPVVVVSRATADGGRAGRFTEARREVAARLIAEGSAHAADEIRAVAFREEVRQHQAEEEARRSARIQVNLVTAEQPNQQKATGKPRAPREDL